MSEIPVGPNDPVQIKLRQASAIIRQIQELAPHLSDVRLLAQETADVVAVHGGVTDTDLTELGINAATLTSLVTFMNQLVAFMDATPAGRPVSYRTNINAVQRLVAYN